MLGCDWRRTVLSERRVLIPRRHEPIGGEGSRERAAVDKGEVAPRPECREPGLQPAGELGHRRLGCNTSVWKLVDRRRRKERDGIGRRADRSIVLALQPGERPLDGLSENGSMLDWLHERPPSAA